MAVTVRVDDREPAAVVEAVRGHPDVVEAEVCRLSAADIVVGTVGVERKTLRDYVNGVAARSGPDVERQVEAMSEAFEHAYLLLEGDLVDVDALPTGVSPAAIRGSIASITARREVPVIPCSTLPLLVDVAVRLGRKHTEDPSRRPISPGTVTSRSEPIAMRMYACIDGIGPALATALYETYPTVEALLEADAAELARIDGIGEQRARAIHDALRETER